MCNSIFSFLQRILLLCGGRISNDPKSLENPNDLEASLLEEQEERERGRLLKVAAPALYPQSHHWIDIHIDGAADFDKPGESPPAFTLDNDNGEKPQFSSVELMLEKEDGRKEDNEVVINCTQAEVLASVSSASLAMAFGSSASNMIASSLDSYEFLMKNYKRAEGHLFELRSRGCWVLHNFDATTMARFFPELKSFDRIVFNFPHTGFPGRHVSRETQIRSHQELVKGFLANAKEMIKEDGEIHIAHKCNGFHLEWCIIKLARSQGLWLLEQVPFRIAAYPGYETKYGFGTDNNFDCNPSKTYKFVLRQRLKELQSKGIKP